MKKIVLIFVYLMFIALCQAAENQHNPQNRKSKEIEEIDNYISRLRLEIESEYKYRIVQANQWTQAEINLLEVPDKAVFANLTEQADLSQTILNINNLDYILPEPFYPGIERTRLFRDGPFISTGYGETTAKFHRRPESPKLAAMRFAEVQTRITERKSRLMTMQDYEIVNIERQKEYALNIILPNLEKRLKENLAKPQPNETNGLITAIIYSPDKSSAVIDSEIVHNGDTIHGVKVKQIHNNKIEFERDAVTWEQQVQQTPSNYWQ
ncbi:MAG: hypothetical protein A2Y12_12810 [Planctomycetes bacterium GWF2_42_9]|nr:MAG: hypothetical protein A2Y12_12810 [Planctomycetes bacterium GWF2_42_9]